LQESAADKFDRLLEVGIEEKKEVDVSKMLAKEEEVDPRPCRIKGRTFSRAFSFF